MNLAPSWTTGRGSRKLLLMSILVAACASDAAVCTYYLCPVPHAGTITVTGSNSPVGVAGLTMTVTVGGAVGESGACTEGSDGTSVCHIDGSIGTYHVALNAPGYQPATVDFTATGVAAGCNTCDHVDLQQRSVVLQAIP